MKNRIVGTMSMCAIEKYVELPTIKQHVAVVSKIFHNSTSTEHGNEYPTMHHFGIPRHTQSMIA